MFTRFLFAIIFLFPALVAAQGPELARPNFEKLVLAADNNDAGQAKNYIAKSAHLLFDRFASYGLLKCLPKDSQYTSEEAAGTHRLVKAGMTALDGKWKLARLYFVKEDNIWKWDMNETLRRGLGANWENRIHTTEQLFLLLRQQMGGTLDCKMVRELAAPVSAEEK